MTIRSEKDIRIKLYDLEQDLTALVLDSVPEPDLKLYQKLVTRISTLHWVLDQ